MNATTTDLLRGELEKNFELDDMLRLSTELLGLVPDEIGGTSAKGAFARALVDACDREDALSALAEAMRFTKSELVDGIDLFAGEGELAPGTLALGWKVQKKLGEGGTGVVYLAEKDGKRAALKVLRRVHAADRGAARRWQTVARAIARVENASVAPVLEVGALDDGRPVVATAFIEGQSLAARVARTGPMHFNEARPLLRGVLTALEALHARGLAHGGIKAENVFVVRPTADAKMKNEPTGVLVDAGADRLASRPAPASASASGVLAIAGTAKGFAPEHARSGAASPSSDLYATACLLFECLTGRAPFTGQSAIDVIAAHLTTPAPAPSTLAPRGWVARELDDILAKALAKDPAERHASATALREALESIGRASIPPEARKKEDLDVAAFDAAKSALLAAPADETLAAALEKVVEGSEEWTKAIEVLREAAGKADDVEVKKALHFRAARLADSELRDHAIAEKEYRDILELDAEEEIARVALEELKRHSGDWEGLVELLLEKVEREQEASERAGILREIAETYDKNQSADNAFVAWVQALTDDPRDERTRAEIERLAGKNTERWNEALASLNEAVNANEDPAAKTALYVLMGRWYADHLGRPDFALPCYGQALALDPASESALDGTVELYRKAQSWQELAAILLRRAEVSASPTRARDFFAEAAEVVHRRLGDAVRASEIFERVLAEDPAHPKATESLETIYAERKEWKLLAALLEKKAASLHGAARVEVLCQLAEIYEDRIADHAEATRHYRAALAEEPRNVSALKGLERIYAQGGKYTELLGVLETQLETVATPRQKIAIYERMGAILEEEFVDRAKAAEAFEAVVAIEPGNDAANAALARLYRHLNRSADLAETLERHARGSEDEKRKVTLLLAATKVLAFDVGAPERALSVADRILLADPTNGEALELTARLRAQAGDVNAAVDAVVKLAESERDAAKKSELYVRAGRILEDAGDKDGAIARYKDALDADKDNPQAAAALGEIYAARGDSHGAAELLLRQIASTDGTITQAKLWADLGVLRRDRLKEPDSAKEAFLKALELDGTCTPAARGLGDLAFDAGKWKEATKHYEPLLSRTGEMTKDEARHVSLRCGDAFAKLSDWSKAQRAFLNAKAFAPDDREVLERVADVTFEAGEADEAAELYRDILKRVGDALGDEDKGRVKARFGEALRRSDQAEEATKALEEAAALLPGNDTPLASLTKVYESARDWEKVVKTLRRRMEGASDDLRFDLLVEAGDVLAQKIGDRQRASKSYVAALEIRADDRNLLTRLMAVYSETKDWSKLVEVILRIADLIDDPMALAKYYNTAASIAHVELGRVDEAADYYEQALEHAPGLGKAFEGLVTALTSKGDWARLESAYRARIKKLEGMTGDAAAKPADLAHLWDSLGELLRHRMSKTGDAVEAFERAHKLAPEDRRRLEQLAEIYAAEPKRHFAQAVAVHQQLLALSPYRIESYQALRKLYTEAKKPDESWCFCQALTVMKNAEPDEEAFFKKHRSRKPAAAKETLTDELFVRHVMHADQDPLLTDIFTTIAPAVIAVRAQPLSAWKLDETKKRDAEKDEADLARTLHYAAGITRSALPALYYRDDDPGALSFVFASPPAIGLGKGGRAGGPAQALAFVAGRHLAFYRGGLLLRQLVPTGSGLRAWLLAAIKSAVPQFPVPADLAGAVNEHLGAFKQHLAGPQQETLRSLVSKLLAAAPELDLRRWTAAVDLTADRLGFVIANDLEIASALVRASPEDSAAVAQKDRLRELALYAVSADYLSLRHKLGLSIG